MRMTIFGASGGVGRELVAQAVERGHQVRAVGRGALSVPGNVEKITIADLTSVEAVADAVRGAEAVLSAVGLRRRNPNNPWSRVVSPTDLTSQFAQTLVSALAREASPPRLIVVSAAGVGDSRARMSGVLRWMFDHSNVGVAYADLEKMEAALRTSPLDWVAVRPVTLTYGKRGSKVRLKQTYGLMDKISRADVAWFMLEALHAPTGADRTPMIARA